jgi:hypothetical protein
MQRLQGCTENLNMVVDGHPLLHNGAFGTRYISTVEVCCGGWHFVFSSSFVHFIRIIHKAAPEPFSALLSEVLITFAVAGLPVLFSENHLSSQGVWGSTNPLNKSSDKNIDSRYFISLRCKFQKAK